MSTFDTPNFWISEANYYQLTGPGYWRINEVPQERLSMLPSPFNLDKTLGVYASGCAMIREPNETSESIAGIDWLRLEANLRDEEPPINVNHFIIGTPKEDMYPVFGPYRSGSIAAHWTDGSDINKYHENESNKALG